MRQIGTLSDERQAQRFVDYLVTLEIAAMAEEDGDAWAIWVRNEEQLPQARDELVNFRAVPDDARYVEAAAKANAVRREREERRKAAGKNVVEMRGQWGRGRVRRAPLTFALIAFSVLVGLLTDLDVKYGTNKYARLLSFRDPMRAQLHPETGPDPFYDIRRGEVWRLVTPIFLHVGPWHLVMNMFWLWYAGSQIEDRRGALRLLLLVLLAAVIPNVAQAVLSGPYFAGMSGVGYALFGYVWMKSRYDPQSGIVVSQLTTFIFLIWFFMGFFPEYAGPIANAAHGGGLLLGVVIGYLPELVPSLRKVL
jgi:GlpG protein